MPHDAFPKSRFAEGLHLAALHIRFTLQGFFQGLIRSGGGGEAAKQFSRQLQAGTLRKLQGECLNFRGGGLNPFIACIVVGAKWDFATALRCCF